MRRSTATYLVTVTLALVAALAGCTPTTSAPAPTAAPAAKAASPTSAPAAAAAPTSAPTAAPSSTTAATAAPKVNYPEKGKSITLIVPFAAGGAGDVAARLLAVPLEKEVGAPIEIVNKAGASTQVGMSALVHSKPDGYTLGQTSFASIFVTYLDKDRNAGYTRDDFQLVGNYASSDNTLSVKSDSPIKSVKDLVDAAKANPEGIKIGTSGQLTNTHLVPLGLAKAAGVKFSYVHFNGDGESLTALLGGHIDVACVTTATAMAQYKSGAIRVLATTGKTQSPFLPDVKTLVAQGYPVTNIYSIGISGPKEMSTEIVNILTNALKKATEDSTLRTKFAEIGMVPDYMDPAQYATYWKDYEAQVQPLIAEGKQ